MTKSAVSFVMYVGLGAAAVAFTATMLWLAAPTFSVPADRPAVGFKLSQDRDHRGPCGTVRPCDDRGDRDSRGACGTYRKCA